MNLYQQKSKWKIYLLLAALVILAVSMMYTNYIAKQLAAGEKAKVELFVQAMESITDENDLDKDVSFETAVTQNIEIPVILVHATGSMESKNFPENANLEQEVEKIKKGGRKPIKGDGYALYFKHTRV